MNVFEFLKFAPKAALFLLPLVLAILTFAIFSRFKKQKKEAVQSDVHSLTPTEDSFLPSFAPPSPSRSSALLILTSLLLVLSLPLTLLLLKQQKEMKIKMRAEENTKSAPSPTLLSEEPTFVSKESTSAFLTPQCERIRIYDEDWIKIPHHQLSSLPLEAMIRIAVREEKEGNFDKGRIRVNNIEWTSENETTDQKPDSPGEFYIECQVDKAGDKSTICGIIATLKDEFKIEGEVHDAVTNEWN